MKIPIFLLFIIFCLGCKQKDTIIYKVGDFCKISECISTAKTDSDYTKIQIYIHDSYYNDDLEQLRKNGIYILLMPDEYYQIAEVFDSYVKVIYTNIWGEECYVRVNKTEIMLNTNPHFKIPVKYPINISKSEVDSFYQSSSKCTMMKILGDFKLGMSQSLYEKLFNNYEVKGTIYTFAADGTMAYSYSDELAAILFPVFKNDKLKSLRCELWELQGGDGGFLAIKSLEEKFGKVYYRNGENYYWFNDGLKVALKNESCSQGSTYGNANTSVLYFD